MFNQGVQVMPDTFPDGSVILAMVAVRQAEQLFIVPHHFFQAGIFNDGWCTHAPPWLPAAGPGIKRASRPPSL